MTAELLIESSIKMSSIVLVALAATVALRRRSAAVRHWILAAALVCAAAAPALERVLPAWQVPVPILARQPAPIEGAQRTPDSSSATDRVAAGAASRVPARRPAVVSAVLIVWAVGATFGALMIVVGLGRLAWIAARAHRVREGAWVDVVAAASREYRIRRPVRLLQSDHRSLLVTWGLVRPTILLPAGAQRWAADRMRLVALHELAHVTRGDWAIQLVGEVVKAVNWFNPLVWIACRRLRQESEHAADDAVLSHGIDGAAYATELLQLARAFVPDRHQWLPAPAIARASSLERRVSAMLSSHVNRRPMSRRARVTTAAALVAVAVTIASAQSVFSSFSGVVYDQMNGLLPNTKLALTNAQTGAKYEIRSDRTGRFEFVGLPPGEYAFETELMGFMPLKGSLEITGQNVQRDLRLQVGSLQETVSVSPQDPPESADAALRRNPFPPAKPVCDAPAPGATGGIGGNIRAPVKLRHVKPAYPDNLRASKPTGLVVLEARIGEDGTIRDVRTVSSPNPDFEAAAVAAVRQWEFSQTLLNCAPVEVTMKVTVNFIAE